VHVGDITTRPATPADAAAIAEIHVRAWQTAYRGMMDDAFLDALSVVQRVAQWRERLTAGRDDLHVWVAEQEGEVVGFCSFGPSDEDDVPRRTAILHTIYVRPGLTRAGVGSALLTRAEQAMREAGYRHAVLWMLKQNANAGAFYDRAGWRADGSEQQFDRMGQPTTEVRRRKAL